MRQPHDIFTMIPMSTPLVREQTRAVVAERGLTLKLLAADFDVDVSEDLQRLAERLEADPSLSETRTARTLARLLR
jgi:glycosyltransferase A (GT-A) superfamily protein (DUF2064 family)